MTMRYLRHSVLGLIAWEVKEESPGLLEHIEMTALLLQQFPDSKVLSAGYVDQYRGTIKCHGESLTLNLKVNNPDDTMDLQRALGLARPKTEIEQKLWDEHNARQT